MSKKAWHCGLLLKAGLFTWSDERQEALAFIIS